MSAKPKPKANPKTGVDEHPYDYAVRTYLFPLTIDEGRAVTQFRDALDTAIALSFELPSSNLTSWTSFNLMKINGEYVANHKAATYEQEYRRLKTLQLGTVEEILELYNMNQVTSITNTSAYEPYHHDDILVCSEHFDDLASGKKTFEIQPYNIDHNYVPGDRITLTERLTHDPENTYPKPFGRKITFTVGFVSDYAIFPGYVCLSLLPDHA